MDKRYFTEYYHLERTHWWFLARASILKSVVLKYSDTSVTGKAKILNVGVATGASSTMLGAFGSVTSVEYDEDCCRFLQDKGIDVVRASITGLPFADNTFDIVCCFDVIEHVGDDTRAISEVHRVVKKGGLVFITVPAFMSLWSEHDEVNHHHRRYTSTSLNKVIHTVPFTILRMTYFNFFLFLPIWAIRRINRLVPLKQRDSRKRSDFSIRSGPGFIRKMLYHIFLSEKRFLLSNVSFPFGVSILAVVKKAQGVGADALSA